MAVMSSGDIVVGKRSSSAKPKIKKIEPTPVIAESPKRTLAPRAIETTSAQTTGRCGAMSQQRADGGMISTPQQFVHLVGCREAKAGSRTGH
jgi:hypothetical protein